MSINDQLLNIYHNKWKTLSTILNELDSKRFAAPFLLAFDDTKFYNSDFRVMIFGQETKGWYRHSELSMNVEDVSTCYDKFFNLKNYYKGYGRSSFWKAFRYFEKEISKAYPDKNIYFSWNNINKIGKFKGTGIDKGVEQIEKKYFSVIQEEVELFKPDIVIFLTGPNRDSKIKFHFEDADFKSVDSNVSARALAQVSSKLLPEKTIRMYHPSYFGGFYKLRSLATSLINL